VLLVWWSRRPRARRTTDRVLLAHTAVLRALPRYQRLARRQRRLGAMLVVASLLVVAGAAWVLARPQHLDTEPRESRARDLILCLDASASMDADNAAVVRELRAIVDQLHGDRVGMLIWSSAAVLVFPLTDDYDYVRAQLDRAQRAFEGHPAGFYDGVDLLGAGASLIGDGIVSCARRFDRPAAARTRVLLVTSDNDPVGTGSYSLPQATQYAAREHVLVYGLGAPSLDRPDRAAARVEFEQTATRTGGVFTVIDQSDGARMISSRIQALARARSDELPRTTSTDAPDAGGLVALGGLVLLTAVSWATRREPA
jgi:hypothetical protein